jgi:putative tricarboxylic transport membrane protein
MADALASFEILLSLDAILLVALGTILGVIVGAIPGLTGAMLIALTLPLTFGMSGEHALVLLISMYVGAVSGGLITATLLRMPGTPASVMTTLDGYPMAQQGRPQHAISLGVCASLVGGSISWGFLAALARPMAAWSTRLGPFDFFALVLMAMALIVAVSGKSLARGLFSGCLGILAAMPGASPATGEIRLTLGFHELDDGFKLLPVLIGVFAVSQIISDIRRIGAPFERSASLERAALLKWSEWKAMAPNMLRSSLIGTWVGVLPGVGANIGSISAYAVAKGVSKHPEKFGLGSEEGIVASEAANNATVGGALIPLIALGIPGSVIDAILLGALVIHGLQPGPLLFEQNPEAVEAIMGAMLLANFVMAAFVLSTAKWLSRLAAVPTALLTPVILTFCVVGTYALANRVFDVWVMLGFGLVGFALEAVEIPLAPFVIGLVLAPLAEEHLGAGLMQSGGSYLPLVRNPIALVFTLLAVAIVVVVVWKGNNQELR